MSASIRHQWIGRQPYRAAWRLQRLRREAVKRQAAPEVLWTVEHDPVITTGRRAVELGPQPVPVVRTERGGLATWHGPGQLVGYLIVDIGTRGGRVKDTVCAIESGILRWLQSVGIVASRRAGHPGVFVGKDKIASVGLHFSRGVSMHGFALNLDPDLSAFRTFVPCGIADAGVTSVARLGVQSPTPVVAAPDVAACVLTALVDTLGASR